MMLTQYADGKQPVHASVTRQLRRLLALSLLLTCWLLGNPVQAAAVFASKEGVAINGIDPVGYFTRGVPVAGQTVFSHEWQGATWLFSTEENKALFVANPAQYAPQYGGFCAYAVSRGYTAKTDPKAWTVHEGKLYLNYSLSVRRKWLRDVSGNVTKADKNWPRLMKD